MSDPKWRIDPLVWHDCFDDRDARAWHSQAVITEDGHRFHCHRCGAEIARDDVFRVCVNDVIGHEIALLFNQLVSARANIERLEERLDRLEKPPKSSEFSQKLPKSPESSPNLDLQFSTESATLNPTTTAPEGCPERGGEPGKHR